MYEDIGLFALGHDNFLEIVSEDYQKIENDTEYIFILQKGDPEEKEDSYYTYVAKAHSYTKTADKEVLAQKVKEGTATELEQFQHSLLTYYENTENTKLDLYREASKYVKDLPEDATQQEILAALPQEHKDLFARMIQQYGVQSDKAVVEEQPSVS